jgi:hypothetical protein
MKILKGMSLFSLLLRLPAPAKANKRCPFKGLSGKSAATCEDSRRVFCRVQTA